MRKFLTVLFLVTSTSLVNAEALPSLTCTFTEPFISVLSFPGGVKTTSPEGNETATKVKILGTYTQPKISAALKSGAITLEVFNKPGSDGMSDRTFPQLGLLTLAGYQTPLHGGCVRMPDGTTPRPIISKTPQKPVGMRKKPNIKSEWLANLRLNELFWAYPEATVKTWVHGAAAKYPAGESGKIAVVSGYVDLKFLGLLK